MKKTKKLMDIALGMKYPVLSQGQSLDVDTPDSMGFEINQALQNLKQAIGGDVDAFVQGRLKYLTKTALYKALSAEQIDAVALAIYNMEAKGQGIIIADQTGIGKGRIASAIIRYAHKQGKKPIFITEKPNLFSDLYRDMADIGSANLKPFIVNGRDAKTIIKDKDGNELYTAPLKEQQDKIIASKVIPSEYDLVMLTYSQVSDTKASPKQMFLAKVSEKNIVILDEAHNASGLSNSGKMLMSVCANASGVTFLSATFAKRADNMPLYAKKTCIADAKLDTESLIEAFKSGGVALQEVVASQLASQGQLIRRERLYEGIEVNYINLDKNAERDRMIADNFTSILRDIINFQKEFVLPEVAQMDKMVRSRQSSAIIEKANKNAGVDATPAFSKVFMLVNQMLFALKADDVANRAIARLREGKKPVIAFSSTMGSFLENMNDEDGLAIKEGTQISAGFAPVLLKSLQTVLNYSIKDETGRHEKEAFDIIGMSDAAIDTYFEITQKIQSVAGGLCISPIDYIKQKIESQGYKVAEVTGRKLEVQLHIPFKTSLNGLGERESYINPTNYVGTVSRRKAESVNDSFRKFNNNEIDVLMINQSGSTGASAHAIVTDKVPKEKVKQRVMIVLQAELDINTEVQKRGRINRTGQILKPIYDYLISSIPAEKRLMMMLQKKLKSLDANTTANQKNSEALMKSEDFLNKYGDEVVYEYMKENPELCLKLDDPIKLLSEEEDSSRKVNCSSKVSGRIAVLPVKEQEIFYKEILEKYHEFIKQLIEDDKFDLEVETMDLKARTLDKSIIQVGAGLKSPFSDHTFIERCEVNILRKPYSTAELDKEIRNSLEGKTPDQLNNEILEEAERFINNEVREKRKSIREGFELRKNRITTEKAYNDLKDQESQEKYVARRLEELEESEEKSENDLVDRLSNDLRYISSLLKFFKVGMKLQYQDTNSQNTSTVLATCLGFRINRTKERPFAPSNIGLRIAVASSKRLITFPSISGMNSQKIFAIKGTSVPMPSGYSFVRDLLPAWEKSIQANSKDRGIKYLITGNIIQAYRGGLKAGKLVQFTTQSGKIRKGILLPEGENFDKQRAKIGVPVQRCSKIIKSLPRDKSIECNNSVSIFREANDDFAIYVSASRQNAGNIYLDADLMKLTQKGLFEKVSNNMKAKVSMSDIDSVLQVLGEKLHVVAELKPEQFDIIRSEFNLENQFSDELQELPVFNNPTLVQESLKNDDAQRRLSLKYKYRLRLQLQILERNNLLKA
jgi:hypothetical protein